jgi:hypothetical protein
VCFFSRFSCIRTYWNKLPHLNIFAPYDFWLMSSSICGKIFRFNLWRIRVEFEKIVCPVTYGHPCMYLL